MISHQTLTLILFYDIFKISTISRRKANYKNFEL